MRITRYDSTFYALKELTSFQLRLIADALEVINPDSKFAEEEARKLANEITRWLER
jgi:hypothetical protein